MLAVSLNSLHGICKMAITVFNDVILPNSILAAGVRGKQMRKNTRTSANNGSMRINIDWSRTLRMYEVGIAPMTAASWLELEGVHEVTEGGAYGFLMEDPKDSTVSTTNGLMHAFNVVQVGAIGVGYGEPVMRCWKRMEAVGTARYKDRRISRPRSSGFVLYRGGTPVTPGSGAGQFALDVDTGTVAMVADASAAHTSITAGATTVLNYADGTMPGVLSPGDRVYISGVTGSAASVLNGRSHAITAEGASSLTISTSTAGLSGSGGASYKYPQASEAMTWSGKFYVPVHFLNDEIDWEMVVSGPTEGRYLAGPSVTLMEVLE